MSIEWSNTMEALHFTQCPELTPSDTAVVLFHSFFTGYLLKLPLSYLSASLHYVLELKHLKGVFMFHYRL